MAELEGKKEKELQFKHIIGGLLIAVSIFFIYNSYPIILKYVSTLDIEYNQEYTLVVGCYIFPIMVLAAIMISRLQHYLGIRKQQYIFNNPGGTWRTTWLISAVCIFLSYLYKHHLYYIYLYFFAVGMISFLNYLRPYAIIDEERWVIFYGNYFARKTILLEWETISNIELLNKKVPVVRTFGSRIWVPVKDEVDVKSISIKLKQADDTLPDKEGIRGKHIVVNNTKTEIILENPPNGGFDDMLEKAARYFKGPSVS